MTAVASGEYVAQHIDGGDVSTAQVQPNGVDLKVKSIYETSGTATFTASGYDKPRREEVHEFNGTYRLDPGPHQIVYASKIEIPQGYVGRVYPRSRLMRSGLHLTSALWDQGYEGVGGGLLNVPQQVTKVVLEKRVPIAQMVFIEADRSNIYDGTHQRERMKQ